MEGLLPGLDARLQGVVALVKRAHLFSNRGGLLVDRALALVDPSAGAVHLRGDFPRQGLYGLGFFGDLGGFRGRFGSRASGSGRPGVVCGACEKHSEQQGRQRASHGEAAGDIDGKRHGQRLNREDGG